MAVLIAAPVAFPSPERSDRDRRRRLRQGVSGSSAAPSDGATANLRVSVDSPPASRSASVPAISVTVVAAGWLLSVAGEVICIVPNALGESLLYNERVR